MVKLVLIVSLAWTLNNTFLDADGAYAIYISSFFGNTFFLISLCISSWVMFVIYCLLLPLSAANVQLLIWLEHREVSV